MTLLHEHFLSHYTDYAYSANTKAQHISSALTLTSAVVKDDDNYVMLRCYGKNWHVACYTKDTYKNWSWFFVVVFFLEQDDSKITHKSLKHQPVILEVKKKVSKQPLDCILANMLVTTIV